MVRVLESCLRVTIGLLVLWTTLSCTPAVRLFVYNHTQNKIWIAGNSNPEVVEPGTLREIKLSNNKHIQFRIEEAQLDYPVPTIPMEYWDSTFTGFSDVHLQVESSGEIYLIKPKVSLPAKDLSDQPAGFPLKPSSAIRLAVQH